MTSLTTAIEGLYHTFAHYRGGPTEGCPCCVTPERRARLHARPLREIAADDLGVYAFKAMSTWGGVDDFRHFLPRIFEIAATDELGYDPQTVVGGKLVYAKWREWRAREQEAIEAFLFAWCDDARTNWRGSDALSSSILAGLEPEVLLRAWRDDQRPACDGAWLELLERLSSSRTLDPWTSPEASDVISHWLWEPPQRARLMRMIEALPDEVERQIARDHLDRLGLRLR